MNLLVTLCQELEIKIIKYQKIYKQKEQKHMMRSSPQRFNINLMQVVNNPIPEDLYPNLETIIKMLQQYMQKCIKNRQYIEAQKTKDKIQQAYSCIKRRNSNQVVDKMRLNTRKLQAKHEEERDMFFYQWEDKIRIRETKFNEDIDKKRRANQQQIVRLREQVEMALPVNHTPDDKLKYLRNEERKLVQQSKFLEAQKVKQQIQNREMMLQQKHKKLRQSNIKSMLEELQERHEKSLREKQREKKKALDQMIQEKNKKLKELEERQAKQMREMKWMHNEEIRLIN